MTDVEIGRRARVVIAQELAQPIRKLSDDAEFVRDLGADSLDLVSLPAALEEEFAIRLTDEEVAFAQTVGTAVDLIRTKLENKGML